MLPTVPAHGELPFVPWLQAGFVCGQDAPVGVRQLQKNGTRSDSSGIPARGFVAADCGRFASEQRGLASSRPAATLAGHTGGLSVRRRRKKKVMIGSYRHKSTRKCGRRTMSRRSALTQLAALPLVMATGAAIASCCHGQRVLRISWGPITVNRWRRPGPR